MFECGKAVLRKMALIVVVVHGKPCACRVYPHEAHMVPMTGLLEAKLVRGEPRCLAFVGRALPALPASGEIFLTKFGFVWRSSPTDGLRVTCLP